MRIVGCALLSVWLLCPPETSGELVMLTATPETMSDIRWELPPAAAIILENPHDQTLLIELPEGTPLPAGDLSKAIVHRNVQDYPVSVPGTVRILVDIDAGIMTRRILQDELREFVEMWGGREDWRSAMISRSHLDVPVKALSHVVRYPLIKAFWFNKPGGQSLVQAVPRLGITSSYGPWYWPWGGFYYIAVLDTGVVDGYPLSGRVDHTLGACFSAGTQTANYKSLCPNGLKEQHGVGAAVPCTLSQCTHGSHVAAAAVSASSPHLGVIAASNVQVLPIQVYTRHAFNNTIVPFESDVGKGLDHVIQAGLVGFKVAAVVLSLDLTGLPSTVACDSSSSLTGYVNSLSGFGTAVFAAAGNVKSTSQSAATNLNEYWGVDRPACISNVIAVGASLDYTNQVALNVPFLENGQQKYFSSQSHTLLDYWAPGANITTPVDPANQVFGTSFATPLAAGVWTRVRAKYPYATNDFIKGRLNSCSSLTDSRPGIPQQVTKPLACWSIFH